MSSKQWLWVSLAFLALIIGILFLMEDVVDIEKKAQPLDAPPVSIVTVTPGPNKGLIRVFAEIKPHWFVQLSAHVNGQIVQMSERAVAGGRVDIDTLLVRIEDSHYKAQMHEAEQTLAEARLALLQEQKKAAQAESDWQRSGIKQSPSALTLNRPQLEIAKQSVKAAKSRLAATRKEYEYTRIKAPFTGFITQRHVSIGQTVNAGDNIVDIINDEQLDITVSLNQSQWQLLHKDWTDNKAVIYNDREEAVATASIKRGGGYMDPQTRQYKLFLEVEQNTSNSVLSGEFVQVDLPGIIVENSMKLPESALTREGYIWYIDNDSRLRRFLAQVLFRAEDHVVVRTPLQRQAAGQDYDSWRIAINPLTAFLSGNAVKPIVRE